MNHVLCFNSVEKYLLHQFHQRYTIQPSQLISCTKRPFVSPIRAFDEIMGHGKTKVTHWRTNPSVFTVKTASNHKNQNAQHTSFSQPKTMRPDVLERQNPDLDEKCCG
jgi:hypothetical protein